MDLNKGMCRFPWDGRKVFMKIIQKLGFILETWSY